MSKTSSYIAPVEEYVATGAKGQPLTVAPTAVAPAPVAIAPTAVAPAPATTAALTQLAASAPVTINPQSVINEQNGTLLSSQVPTIGYQEMFDGLSLGNHARYDWIGGEAQTAEAQTMDTVAPQEAAEYDVAKSYDDVYNETLAAAQGQLSDGSVVNAEQIDVEGTGQGLNETGKALNDFAKLDLDDVDARATTQGQLAALQAQFKNDAGEAIIPAWAAGTARNVSKIAAFSGMTGSAATAAMAQAIMEASLPIATMDAQFYQTVTLTNLSNKQQSIINKANVLSQFNLANLDARMTAAVENSRSFLQMDLANLSNEQQARVINNQNRVQSILEDTKQENAKRLFVAESKNDMNKFYDSLNASIEQFNTSQVNAMAQFNSSEINGMTRFNAELDNNRQQFYATMQYNVDQANAKWRQTVTLTNTDMAFQAAATDVKNLVGISVEQMNQQWDRADALLDYVWKSSENEMDRTSALIIAKLQADSAMALQNSQNKAASQAATNEGIGKLIGTGVDALLGSSAGKTAVNSLASGLFGWLG